MRPYNPIFAATMIVGTFIAQLRAETKVSVDFFHENLEPYGDWREIGDYGYCWQPRNVDRDWRPYSDGRWLYTDAGWTWDSEEPFAWAVYHYGRWTNLDQIGWVWVPGTEWGPAWVSWRRSERHVGWAPLPPEATFDRSVGFGARLDADYDIGPTSYNFVEVRNFGSPRLQPMILRPRENIAIIYETTNITRIRYADNVVYNDGPRYEVISRESAQPIRRLKLERREQFDGDARTPRAQQFRDRVEGDSFRVVAPTFDQTRATAPRKVGAKVDKVEVDRGWKNAGSPDEVAKARTRIKTEPAAAPEAQPIREPMKDRRAGPPATPRVSTTPPSGKGPNSKKDLRDENPRPAAPAIIKSTPAPRGEPAAERPARPEKTDRPDRSTPPDSTAPRTARPIEDRPDPADRPVPKKPEQSGEAPRLPESERRSPPAPGAKVKPKGEEPKRGLPPAPARPKAPTAPAPELNRDQKPERPPIQSVERKPTNRPPEPDAGKLPPRPQRPPEAKQMPAKPGPSKAVPAEGKKKGKEKDERKEPNS